VLDLFHRNCTAPIAPAEPSSSPPHKICILGGRHYDEDNLIAMLGNPAGTPEQKQFSLMILQRCIALSK
jgi:hypothetical protein